MKYSFVLYFFKFLTSLPKSPVHKQSTNRQYGYWLCTANDSSCAANDHYALLMTI